MGEGLFSMVAWSISVFLHFLRRILFVSQKVKKKLKHKFENLSDGFKGQLKFFNQLFKILN